MNPDPLFQSCSVPEEEEDEDAELQGYDKKEKKKMQRYVFRSVSSLTDALVLYLQGEAPGVSRRL